MRRKDYAAVMAFLLDQRDKYIRELTERYIGELTEMEQDDEHGTITKMIDATGQLIENANELQGWRS